MAEPLRGGPAVKWPIWGLVVFDCVLAAFLLVPSATKYPGALVGSLAFFAVQLFLPSCHPVGKRLLCPWNWALFVFFLQLVLLPLSVLVFGPEQGQLPFLPSASATNLAMVINAVAFLAFCLAYSHFSRRARKRQRVREVPSSDRDNRKVLPLWLIFLYGVTGLTGLLLAFGNLSGLEEYFSNPGRYLGESSVSSDKLVSAAGLFLRPYLGIGMVMLWCRWLDRQCARRALNLGFLATAMAMLGVVLSEATFHYNRGSVVVPLVAMLAVLLGGEGKTSKGALASAGAIAALVLFLTPFYGTYRSENLTAYELVSNYSARKLLAEKVNPAEMFQVYGGAPQFLGYFLEAERWGRPLRWGRVLVSSILSPLPILGKPFRQSTGSAIYNRSIYGLLGVADQIPPFQGEVFLDFNVAGVAAAFFLLGCVAYRFQRLFEGSRSSFDLFLWQYFSVWTFFLIFGSISVVSQACIYFGTPLFAYLGYRRLRRPCVKPPNSLPGKRGIFPRANALPQWSTR